MDLLGNIIAGLIGLAVGCILVWIGTKIFVKPLSNSEFREI